MSISISRRTAVRGLLLGGFAASFLRAQEYGRARDLVARIQDDLQRAGDFSRNSKKDRERYHDVQRKLSDFDRDLHAGHFDKGKLDGTIDELKEVVKNNTLESRDRDALATDLAELRTLRDEYR